MDERFVAAFAVLPDYLRSHIALSAAALALGVVISLPLAVLAARSEKVRWPVLAGASLIQTIPSLALLALFYPLLLALSTLTRAAFGVSFPALGFLPSVLALTLYSMLPILRNAVAGLRGVSEAVREAADGVGMTPRQRLYRVEAPLAAPVMMAGVRTAAVLTIGTATLATPVGQTSLGNYIFAGLQTENWVFVLFGCAAAAGLALVVDQLLALIETGLARRQPRRILLGAVALLVGTAVALAPLLAQPPPRYVIGAKNFGEQFILARLMGMRLEARGGRVQEKDGLGSAVIFRALAAGDLDAYVDYSGTLWSNVLGRTDSPPREVLLAELTRQLRGKYGVEVLGPLGFENAYALAMKADRAAALGVTDIAGLAAKTPDLTLGSDLEFLSRPEWKALKTAYGLKFKAERSYNPTFMYRALRGGEADVISAFSSDGRIAAEGLKVLADPRHAIPPYDAVILVSPRRAKDAGFTAALKPLVGSIPVERMRQANYMVDRETDKATPDAAAKWLAGK
ncbi:MAG TPA: ABC transporter permease/substrate-binding protein [Caulobacteraceae bacterium]|nr:ABC transporter permease/substrate-binding protein [Caulobacteraceae bacterium]